MAGAAAEAVDDAMNDVAEAVESDEAVESKVAGSGAADGLPASWLLPDASVPWLSDLSDG